MALLPYVFAYAALVVFSIAVVARIIMWAKLPMHLRWELYPVAHEASKAHYGGSYLEELDWWKKPREKSLVGELKVMVPEILFLVALFEHNRKLWLRSFPFHFGLYLVIACTVLMMVGGVSNALLPSLLTGGLGTLWQWAIVACGAGGLALGLLGAIGLLLRRMTTPALRSFSSVGDYFNLLLFIATFGLALISFAVVDRDFAQASLFVRNLVTFDLAALPASGASQLLPQVTAVLLAVLVAYIPLTHMSHFIGKYFAYHAIRWNDAPNLRGGREEPVIAGLLAQKITWAAPHIRGEGKKSWVDAATEEAPK